MFLKKPISINTVLWFCYRVYVGKTQNPERAKTKGTASHLSGNIWSRVG